MITTIPEIHQQFLSQIQARTGQGVLPSFEELAHALPQGSWESPQYAKTLAQATQTLSALGPQGVLRAKQLNLYFQLQSLDSTMGSISVIQANRPEPDPAITARKKALEEHRTKLNNELNQALAQDQQYAQPTTPQHCPPQTLSRPIAPAPQTLPQANPMTQVLELMVSMLTMLIQLVQPPAAQPPR
jgi:hypothetical protein